MTHQTEVLFNGSCPICSREVGHYARLSRNGAMPIRYDDLDDPGQLARWGIDRETAARRLHVRKDGRVHAGLDAFIVLWRDIPQTRWLARVASLPGLHFVAKQVYERLLAPLLYRMHIRRRG